MGRNRLRERAVNGLCQMVEWSTLMSHAYCCKVLSDRE